MTEAEWFACEDPVLMLDFLRGKTSDRKWRLFGCACCRELWADIREGAGRTATEVAERFADGAATGDELWAAYRAAGRLLDELTRESVTPAERAAGWVASEPAIEAAEFVLGECSRVDFDIPYRIILWWRQKKRMRRFQVRVLRDIFGSPFRPVTFSPEWRTDTALPLAQGMYDSRDFGAMPILADVLQDAGCGNEDILNHCRDASLTHVRGCWVVDLVLGKV